MRGLRGLLGPALSLAAFGLLGYALGRDLLRWREGRPHLPVAAEVMLLVLAAAALALASTLLVRTWARVLAAG